MAAAGPSSPDTPKTSCNDGSSAAKAALASVAASATTTTNANEEGQRQQHSKIRMPTYHSTKESKAYTLANSLLKSGSFDDALATLEMALQFSREIVTNHLVNDDGNQRSLKSDDHHHDGDEDETSIELHESLAPLYYLYGTTLLYSVEESDVMMTANTDGNPQQQEQEHTGDDGAEEQDDFEVPPEEEEGQAPEVEEENYEDGEGGGQEDAAPTVADAAEDMQIAWENLDLARSIVSRLVEKFPNSYHASDEAAHPPAKSSADYTPEQQRELLLDLAQIHTRLGDIQRSNDNLLSCIDDYHHALTLRLETLGNYHRKVADSHFCLAAVYAQAPNQMGENEGRVNKFVNSLGGGVHEDEDDSTKEGKNGGGLTEEEKAHFRQRSLEHYLACGVAFAGMLAQMCGMDPDELTAIDNVSSFESSSEGTIAAASMSAGDTASTFSIIFTQAMATLRQRITALAQQSAVLTALSPEDREEFTNVQEMLDEIQEAMDSAKETEAGLKTLSEMKANEIKKHEMKMNGGDDAEEVNGGGSGVGGGVGGITTTIGFASGTLAAAAATGTTTLAAAAGPTMMVVKKKKKQQLPQAGVEEDSFNKRAKTI